MDAYKIIKNAVFFGVIALAPPALSETTPVVDNEAEILAILNKSLAASIIKFEQTVERCSKIASSRSPVIDKTRLKDSKVNTEDLVVAISHFYFKNMFDCEKAARSEAAFDLAMIISLKENQNLSAEDIKQIQYNLVLQPFEQLNYQVKYNLLSSDIKKYLLEALSGEPFDLLKTLENNGLSHEHK